MIGHEEILERLSSLARSGDLAHGYIFSGPENIGKKLAASIFASHLETGIYDEGKLLQDCSVLFPQNGSIGIEKIRELKRMLWQMPAVSKYRTAIIDDAHLLTEEAQNALLKVTEEPPSFGLLILVVPDQEMIAATLRSRFQCVNFGVVHPGKIAKWLEDHGVGREESLRLAKRSFGRPGLAWLLKNDDSFVARLDAAARFLETPKSQHKDMIKLLTAPDDFDFRKFLDAVILLLAWSDRRETGLWHRALSLRRAADSIPLNPKLQLEALVC